MVKKTFGIFALLFVLWSSASAADSYQQGLLWVSYTNNLKINDKWKLSSEIHERVFLHPFTQHQNAYRFKLIHPIGKNSNWEISPGMVFFLQSTPQHADRNYSLIVPELRPQFELLYAQKMSKVNIQHRYRFEARFNHNVASDKKSLEDGYSFSNFRVRYQIMATFPLLKFKNDQKLQFRLGDEIHVNLGKKVVDNYFDQNRIFSSFLVDITPDFSLELGYLYWYQHASNNDRIHRHFLRFGITQTIQLKSKKS